MNLQGLVRRSWKVNFKIFHGGIFVDFVGIMATFSIRIVSRKVLLEVSDMRKGSWDETAYIISSPVNLQHDNFILFLKIVYITFSCDLISLNLCKFN